MELIPWEASCSFHSYKLGLSQTNIVSRSGFLDLLSTKKEVSEILDGDSIMTDKGFDIEGDLQIIGLELNNASFLKEQPQFNESEVITKMSYMSFRRLRVIIMKCEM